MKRRSCSRSRRRSQGRNDAARLAAQEDCFMAPDGDPNLPNDEFDKWFIERSFRW